MSELTWLTEPGRSNPLATWVTQGGQIWMFGGGCANALQSNFERHPPQNVFANADTELVPGRFMYDVFGWRSAITARSFVQATRPDHPQTRDPAMPDPSVLPDGLSFKTSETDDIHVFAPARVTSPGFFYQESQPGDGLTRPNDVIEDPDPGVSPPKSVLDTLYESVGGQLGSGRPVMTIMHPGDGSQRQVYAGFQLWYWQRNQQIALLDWVLQKVWGLTRTDVPR